jgi:hypothetical protein
LKRGCGPFVEAGGTRKEKKYYAGIEKPLPTLVMAVLISGVRWQVEIREKDQKDSSQLD